VLVTYDDDFLRHDALDCLGVLFQPDDRTPLLKTANIIDSVSRYVCRKINDVANATLDMVTAVRMDEETKSKLEELQAEIKLTLMGRGLLVKS